MVACQGLYQTRLGVINPFPNATAPAQVGQRAYAAAPAAALSPEEWRSFKLVHREQLTDTAHPVWLFRFELPDRNQVVGLPVASCLLTRAPATKKDGTPTWAIRP